MIGCLCDGGGGRVGVKSQEKPRSTDAENAVTCLFFRVRTVVEYSMVHQFKKTRVSSLHAVYSFREYYFQLLISEEV